MKPLDSKVLVVGAGLAGSDAAWYLANKGVSVVLAEVKREKLGPAQKIESFGELVCTNSLKSMNPDSGHGLLKNEMKALGSLVLDKFRFLRLLGTRLVLKSFFFKRENFLISIRKKFSHTKSDRHISSCRSGCATSVSVGSLDTLRSRLEERNLTVDVPNCVSSGLLAVAAH